MKKKIALALGGGAARGCAHLGVIRAIEEQSYEIEAISGTSIGALVGGIYASENLQELRNILPKITKTKVLSYWDFNFMSGSGIVKGRRAEELIERLLAVKTFKKLNIPFYAVASNIKNGKKSSSIGVKYFQPSEQASFSPPSSQPFKEAINS